MKEIYVERNFLGFKAITKAEAEEGINNGKLVGVQLEMQRDDDILMITLLTPSCFAFGDDYDKKLVDSYFDYVESITGMVSKPDEV